MKANSPAHLYDVCCAGRAIREFVAGKTFSDYVSSDQLRSAVERKFQIMGEALNRIRREEPDLLVRIRDYREVISFRR